MKYQIIGRLLILLFCILVGVIATVLGIEVKGKDDNEETKM